MGTARVLVVEDEPEVAAWERRLLEDEGYEVAQAADGEEALVLAATFRPDLALIDLGLPGRMDGLAVARRLRQASPLGVIYVSGRGSRAEVVAGLDSGADDYITKPFHGAELVARVRAVLRRRAPESNQVWEMGDLLVDEGAHRVTCAGAEVALTPIELAMLRLLVRHPARVVTKTQLSKEVWGWEDAGDNLLHVHMGWLRRKLEAAGCPVIHTVRGVGYMLRV